MKIMQRVASRLRTVLRALWRRQGSFPASKSRMETGTGPLQREFVITSFRGGPLDGWSDIVEVTRPGPLQGCLTLPISEDLLLDVQGINSAYASGEITSFATYRLREESARWVYEFVGSATSRAAAEGQLSREGVR